jgi:MFS family permease
MGLFSSLNREQKEAVGLLQIGTFLEYFDLMLYIHMAVLLNELFFPKTDPHTAALLTALAFCSTYVMRPIGALIFGWLGDNIGRKSTIIITTIMMSVSCVIMALLPTYAQIGISAAWIVTLCRIVQGMSSMGEIVGAQIYVAETIPRPLSYPAVAIVSISSALGGTAALGVATLVTFFLMNWRIAFWIGAGIALVGAVARTRLRETPDFLEMKRKQIKFAIAELNYQEMNENPKKPPPRSYPTWKEPIAIKTLLSYFFVYCGWPLSFYLAYMYFTPILKEDFGYSPNEIIMHNFLVSLASLVSSTCWTALTYYIHPIKIIKVRWVFAFTFWIALPFLVLNLTSSLQLLLLQMLILTLNFGSLPGEAVFNYHLPIYRRFTLATFLFALSRALIYVITSFGLVYLGSFFGTFGMWVITLPMGVAYLYGILHFENLERKIGIYPNLCARPSKQENTKLSRMKSLNANKKGRKKNGPIFIS